MSEDFPQASLDPIADDGTTHATGDNHRTLAGYSLIMEHTHP
jgi:hypothetical protein